MESEAFTPRGELETREGANGEPPTARALAVKLHDLTVHNNRKWLDMIKGADVRVDAVIVQGNALTDDDARAYAPATLRFPDVGDGDTLAEDALLVYYGWPRHFLDLSLLVSRDRKDSDELAQLLKSQEGTQELSGITNTLIGLGSSASPEVAAVQAAIAAATQLADLAYRLVRATSGNTIGIYRGCRLAYPDRFGVGRNPRTGVYHKQHLSFWYEVVDAEDPANPQSDPAH
jgi:hypothetical protein